MANVVVMPKLGLMMEEGLIAKWHKAEGDTVEKGDVLFSVETEKITEDIESETAGVIRKIIAKENETVECTKPVAIIADENEDISLINI